MSDHIERLTLKDYGPVKDLSVRLTPLHAFIGPNDSGKSTLLRAMRTAVQLAGSTFTLDERDQPEPFDPGLVSALKHSAKEARIEVCWRNVIYRVWDPGNITKEIYHQAVIHRFDVDEEMLVDGQQVLAQRRKTRKGPRKRSSLSALRAGDKPSIVEARRFFWRGAHMLRLDPDALREPSPLITGPWEAGFEDERGRGLPGVYDLILNQKVDGFLAIQERVRALFPGIKAIGLENVSASTKEIRAQITSGEWISARFLSEGLLYYLAFAALQYLERPAVLLVEEPENGLHPARIAEVMRILREISKETQVLIATHSPLVVNEMQPEEVSVVTRKPETGTKVTLLADTPDFEARSKIYALGELWIAYANGEDEAPLLEGREP